jgi:hypothetical protein
MGLLARGRPDLAGDRLGEVLRMLLGDLRRCEQLPGAISRQSLTGAADELPGALPDVADRLTGALADVSNRLASAFA